MKLTGILGQICVRRRKDFWEITNKNPITEDTDETGKVGVEMPYVKSRKHSDYDSAESFADSNLEDGELRKMQASPLCVHERGENYGSPQKTHSFMETGSKNNTEERSKCTTYSS